MNNWLQNIKGQLTELATDVLNEATEEGQLSSSSELQVEKKRCTESERLYLSEKAKSESFEKKIQSLEDQLYSTNIENDAIKEKFTSIVADRDRQIAQLNNELERLKFEQFDNEGFKSIDLNLPSSSSSYTNTENIEITRLKEKHQNEITILMTTNALNIQQIRDEYEQRIKELETWAEIDTVNKQRKICESRTNTFPEPKSEFCTKINEGVQKEMAEKDQHILQLKTRMADLEQSIWSMKKSEEETIAKEQNTIEEINRLRALNAELMSSYNEMSEQLQNFREGSSPAETVSDLSTKIASLKSMLNETETRYELCKMEQNETSSRLEQLLREFANLKSSMQAAKATAEGNEKELMTEIHSLRDTLEKARDDRERLITDFRQSMKDISEQLTQLRDCNRKLSEENVELGSSLTEFENLRDSLNLSNLDLSNFREKFAQIQSEHVEEIKTLTEERDQLQQKLADCTKDNQNDVVKGESTNEDEDAEEMMTQIRLLETELRAKDEELTKLRSEKMLTSVQVDEYKRPSSDTDSATSNNDWEKMAKEEIEVEGVSTSTGSELKDHSHLHEYEAERGRRETGTQCDEIWNEKQGDEMGAQEELQRMEEEQLQSKNFIIKELETKLDKATNHLGALANEKASFEKENTEMRNELSELRTKFEILERELLEEKERIENESKRRFLVSKEAESLNVQLEKAVETNGHLATANGELLAENGHLTEEIARIVAECDNVRDQLRIEKGERAEHISQAEEQINVLQANLAQLRNKNGELEGNLAEITEKYEREKSDEMDQSDQSAQLLALTGENEELKSLVQKKHSESQEYYEKLQEFASSCEKLEQLLKTSKEALLVRDQEVALRNERISKLESELNRLREHLIVVEDISAKEAIAAEERETELRKTIRTLQEKSSSEESNVAQSLESYQNELMELKTKNISLAEDRETLKSTLRERELSLGETNRALTNLQKVLKELNEDQRKERAQLERELKIVREKLEDKSHVLSQVEAKYYNLEEVRTEDKRNLELLETQLSRKSALVEELENQLEEVRLDGREMGTCVTASGGVQNPSTSSYKIDDSTLRQLFLSFFTADKSKQPEIAIVMSKILGYSTEDQATLQKALKASSGNAGSWFGLLGGGPNRPERSLTEQFIRFLEQESVTRAQPVALQVQSDSRGTNFLVGDSPALAQWPPSTSDLKLLFDS